MPDQRVDGGGDHRASGLRAAVEQQQRLVGQVLVVVVGPCRPQRHEVVVRALAALGGQVEHGQAELPGGDRGLVSDVAQAAPCCDRRLRPVLELGPIGVWEAEQPADHPGGQRRGQRGHRVHRALLQRLADLLDHHRPDPLGVAFVHVARGEAAVDEAAALGVLRIVHADHGGVGRQLRAVAAGAGPELGIALDGGDVGVAGDAPQVVRLVVVDGGVLAQPGVQRPGIGRVHVAVEQVDAGPVAGRGLPVRDRRFRRPEQFAHAPPLISRPGSAPVCSP
ncbi:hypothetical protein AB0B45_31735 [Nonomuraea sp. NPDC049152]|uniref:hypothetical protein n=1 Tax=Nonomuraea sp. NPDC049152 TaxID=3154350 RepID=UPI0033CF2203